MNGIDWGKVVIDKDVNGEFRIVATEFTFYEEAPYGAQPLILEAAAAELLKQARSMRQDLAKLPGRHDE